MKKNIVKILAGLLLVTSVGCGKSFDGTYTGNETVQSSASTGYQQQGQTAAAGPTQTGTVSVQITESGSTVNGTWTGSLGTGSFTGTSGSDSITGVTLTVSAANNNSNYGGYQSCTGVTYSGTLSTANNTLTGTLTANVPAATTGTQQQYSPQSACAGTRTVNATKTN